jgi:hypothetical protein
MGQSWYFWIAVAAATVMFAVIDLDALSKRRIGRVHTVSLIAYLASFGVIALAFLHTSGVWVFPAVVRIAIVAILIGGRMLAGSARTGERLVHPEHNEPEDWRDMSMEEMEETLTPDQLAAEEAYERSLREPEEKS